jgi:hypothetical protein
LFVFARYPQATLDASLLPEENFSGTEVEALRDMPLSKSCAALRFSLMSNTEVKNNSTYSSGPTGASCA